MRLIIIIIFLPIYAWSQGTIDADDFFRNGLSNYKQTEKQKVENVNFPWINRYEFRTETRDFDFEKQEYTFRLSPSTPSIRNAQKLYYEEMSNAPDFEGDEIYCNQLHNVHTDWLELFIISEHQRLLDDLRTIIEDKQSIYEKMIASYEIDAEEILNLKIEKSDLKINQNILILKQEYLLNKYGITEKNINFGDFVKIETISTLLPSVSDLGKNHNIVDNETAYKTLLINKELELETAEKKQLIDFFQVKYNGPHEDPFQERISVGLGFQFFNSGSTKLKMQELKIEQEELRTKSERWAKEKLTRLTGMLGKLERDIKAYVGYQEIMLEERRELEQLRDNISQSTGTSPLLLLEIEERHISMKMEALSMKEELLEDYLEYLQESEKMCQAIPFNFLAE